MSTARLPMFLRPHLIGLSLIMTASPVSSLNAQPQPMTTPIVRLAELQVDPAQVDAFMAAAKAHVGATLQLEPGVLAFHVAAEKGHTDRVRVLEMYVDQPAYAFHLQSPHFQQFRTATQGMTLSRELHDTVPVLLGAKPSLTNVRPMVRVAEIDIDPPRLDAYKAAVSEEIEASIRAEPGVLAIYAVSLRDRPTHLRFFEIYADDPAYRQHIASSHFRKYVDTTKSMITSRVLLEAEPVALGLKAP